MSYHEHADVSGRVLWFKLFNVRLWPPEDEEEQKTKSETEPVFADFEKTPVLSENDSEIRKTEVSVLTENEQQEIPLETVAETSKAEEKKTAGDDRTAVPAEDDELVVHATELISESNESSSPSVLPADALKNSSKENFKESVVKEERVEEVKNCFGAKIKEKLARLIKQARTLWDRLRELPGKIRKLADGRNIKEEHFSGKDLEQHLDVLARRAEPESVSSCLEARKKTCPLRSSEKGAGTDSLRFR